MTISGPTGSGKTWLVNKLLQNKMISPKPDGIIYLYKRLQPLYDEMRTIPNIEFIRGIPTHIDKDYFFDTDKNNLVICDDLMSITADDQKIADLFSEGSHHRNLSVVNITQNLFPRGKHSTTQRRNTQYMIIFKSPMSQDQIRTLSSFMFPGKLDSFMRIYNEATEIPHGHLVIDNKQNTSDKERFKTNVTEPYYAPPGILLDEGKEGRYICMQCDKKFHNTTPFLYHLCPIQCTGNNTEIDHLPSESQSDNTMDSDDNIDSDNNMDNDDKHACIECGALYDSMDSLQKHVTKCNDESSTSDETDDETDAETDDDDSVWGDMINDVFKENDDEFQEKSQQYINEPNGRKKALEEMHPIYKKGLKQRFRQFATYQNQLENNAKYKKIMSDAECFDTDFKKALKASMNDNIFDELVKEEEDDTSSETDDSTDDSTESEES